MTYGEWLESISPDMRSYIGGRLGKRYGPLFPNYVVKCAKALKVGDDSKELALWLRANIGSEGRDWFVIDHVGANMQQYMGFREKGMAAAFMLMYGCES